MSDYSISEMQNLMKLYRDGIGYVTSSEDFDKMAGDKKGKEKELFLKKSFFVAVVKRTADYISKIEKSRVTQLHDKAYKVAVSLLMCSLDIANLYEIDLSEKVMSTLMEKFSNGENV